VLEVTGDVALFLHATRADQGQQQGHWPNLGREVIKLEAVFHFGPGPRVRIATLGTLYYKLRI